MKTIIKIIQEKRGNPILLLDLKEVRKGDMLTAHKLLCNDTFKTLDVILQTPGGDADASFQLMKLLRKKATVVNIIVPLFAKSAGTLMCLGADKILLTDLSELGPLDTQIPEQQDGGDTRFTSALNGFKALEQIQLHTLETMDITTKLILSRSQMKTTEAIQLAIDFASKNSGTLYAQFNPYKIGEYARVLEIGERYGIILLTRYLKWTKEDAERTVKTLVKQYPSHGFVIDLEELQRLNLPAERIEDELLEGVLKLREILLQTKENNIELFPIEIINDTLKKESVDILVETKQ